MVVSGAVQHVGGRVRELFLLDAFLPSDGDSVHSLLGQHVDEDTAPGRPWLVEGPVRAYDDPAEAAFSTPRRTPHPVRCFTEPVRLPRPLEEFPFSRTYVRATVPDPEVPPNPAFDAAAARARASAAWRYAEMETTHLVAQNRPADLTRLLLRPA